MTAYIKFCGGCNEGFSRAAAALRIKEAFAGQISFESHDPEKSFDLGILIEGCPVRCVNKDNLASCDKLIEVLQNEDTTGAIGQIKHYISEKNRL